MASGRLSPNSARQDLLSTHDADTTVALSCPTTRTTTTMKKKKRIMRKAPTKTLIKLMRTNQATQRKPSSTTRTILHPICSPSLPDPTSIPLPFAPVMKSNMYITTTQPIKTLVRSSFSIEIKFRHANGETDKGTGQKQDGLRRGGMLKVCVVDEKTKAAAYVHTAVVRRYDPFGCVQRGIRLLRAQQSKQLHAYFARSNPFI